MVVLLGCIGGCADQQVVLNDDEKRILNDIRKMLSEYISTQGETLYAMVMEDEQGWGVIIRSNDALAYELDGQNKGISPAIDSEKALQLRCFCQQIASKALELMENCIGNINHTDITEDVRKDTGLNVFPEIVLYEFHIDIAKADAIGLIDDEITKFVITINDVKDDSLVKVNKRVQVQIVDSSNTFAYLKVIFDGSKCGF